MPLSFIAAVAQNSCIGSNNELPWYLPEDLKRFKALTLGHPVVMGRKTFESILKRLGKPLPGRTNIVLSRKTDFKVPEGVFVYTSIDKIAKDFSNQEIFIIGGGEVYNQLFPQAAKLYLTEVHKSVSGDVFFPVFNRAFWQEVEREDREEFSFVTYIKKNIVEDPTM